MLYGLMRSPGRVNQAIYWHCHNVTSFAKFSHQQSRLRDEVAHYGFSRWEGTGKQCALVARVKSIQNVSWATVTH